MVAVEVISRNKLAPHTKPKKRTVLRSGDGLATNLNCILGYHIEVFCHSIHCVAFLEIEFEVRVR